MLEGGRQLLPGSFEQEHFKYLWQGFLYVKMGAWDWLPLRVFSNSIYLGPNVPI